MKYIVSSIVIVAGAFIQKTHAEQPIRCATYLESQVQTYAVEAKHIVDICLPQGETVKFVKVGDDMVWLFNINLERSQINLSPNQAGSLTNMIVMATTSAGHEKRYEIRLVSIKPDKRVGQRFPSKPANP